MNAFTDQRLFLPSQVIATCLFRVPLAALGRESGAGRIAVDPELAYISLLSGAEASTYLGRVPK